MVKEMKSISLQPRNETEKWWLKKREMQPAIASSENKLQVKLKPSPSPSPDVSSSMAEFLEKEKFCKVNNLTYTS